jgi:hypothetical protein
MTTVNRNSAAVVNSAAKVSGAAPVGPNSVKWTGMPTVTYVMRYRQDTQPVVNGTVKVHQSIFGAPGNVNFGLQVWAPGVTDQWWDKAAAIRAMDLHVESPLIPGNKKIPVTYEGQAGINGNDFKVQVRWSEMRMGSSSADKNSQPGTYPVHFKAGNKTLATIMVEYSH